MRYFGVLFIFFLKINAWGADFNLPADFVDPTTVNTPCPDCKQITEFAEPVIEILKTQFENSKQANSSNKLLSQFENLEAQFYVTKLATDQYICSQNPKLDPYKIDVSQFKGTMLTSSSFIFDPRKFTKIEIKNKKDRIFYYKGNYQNREVIFEVKLDSDGFGTLSVFEIGELVVGVTQPVQDKGFQLPKGEKVSAGNDNVTFYELAGGLSVVNRYSGESAVEQLLPAEQQKAVIPREAQQPREIPEATTQGTVSYNEYKNNKTVNSDSDRKSPSTNQPERELPPSQQVLFRNGQKITLIENAQEMTINPTAPQVIISQPTVNPYREADNTSEIGIGELSVGLAQEVALDGKTKATVGFAGTDVVSSVTHQGQNIAASALVVGDTKKIQTTVQQGSLSASITNVTSANEQGVISSNNVTTTVGNNDKLYVTSNIGNASVTSESLSVQQSSVGLEVGVKDVRVGVTHVDAANQVQTPFGKITREQQTDAIGVNVGTSRQRLMMPNADGSNLNLSQTTTVTNGQQFQQTQSADFFSSSANGKTQLQIERSTNNMGESRNVTAIISDPNYIRSVAAEIVESENQFEGQARRMSMQVKPSQDLLFVVSQEESDRRGTNQSLAMQWKDGNRTHMGRVGTNGLTYEQTYEEEVRGGVIRQSFRATNENNDAGVFVNWEYRYK